VHLWDSSDVGANTFSNGFPFCCTLTHPHGRTNRDADCGTHSGSNNISPDVGTNSDTNSSPHNTHSDCTHVVSYPRTNHDSPNCRSNGLAHARAHTHALGRIDQR
jgi:hypothetical protein